MISPYRERGGVLLPFGKGSLSVTWPFCTLELDQASLKLQIGGKHKEFDIPITDIESVERKKYIPFIADGVKITTRSGSPEWIIFWSLRSAEQIINILKERITSNQR